MFYIVILYIVIALSIIIRIASKAGPLLPKTTQPHWTIHLPNTLKISWGDPRKWHYFITSDIFVPDHFSHRGHYDIVQSVMCSRSCYCAYRLSWMRKIAITWINYSSKWQINFKDYLKKISRLVMSLLRTCQPEFSPLNFKLSSEYLSLSFEKKKVNK